MWRRKLVWEGGEDKEEGGLGLEGKVPTKPQGMEGG